MDGILVVASEVVCAPVDCIASPPVTELVDLFSTAVVDVVASEMLVDCVGLVDGWIVLSLVDWEVVVFAVSWLWVEILNIGGTVGVAVRLMV